MLKIQTIFDRNWEGNRGVIDKPVVILPPNAVATEKLDGTNVRLTIRNHTIVRVEKRKNPSKFEKAKGIVHPWYIDASEYEPQDKYIIEAAKNTDISYIEDGEWSGEAVGEKIQGNPLNIEGHTVYLFSHPETRNVKLTFNENPPIGFNEIKIWLSMQSSLVGNNSGIEGIVWWVEDTPVGKIKKKDFKV